MLNIGDIYKRIKLNLKTIEKIYNNINYINFNNEFDKMEKEINECNKKLFIFEREKLFKDINQENFINVIINEFKNNEFKNNELIDNI